ncbi:hypothetical protein G6F40_014868 [Rhizopus arrhizus]|nr:hypothetical protein G6F40_014868 [Rhizopus arrhizus]
MRAQLDENASLVDIISPGSEWVEIGGTRKHVMTYLGDFLFAPARAGAPGRSLSGGERARLLLARLFARPANVLVLDEPTLGLDILYRKEFYQRLLEDYFDEQKTIIVTTHQVEEIEHILSDVMFIRDGRIVLDAEMDDVGQRYTELLVNADQLETARALKPIDERSLAFGKTVMLFDGVPRDQLSTLGETRIPGLADLFVAIMKGTYA